MPRQTITPCPPLPKNPLPSFGKNTRRKQMSSPEIILEKLSLKSPSFEKRNSLADLHVVPNLSDKPEEMLSRFIAEAEKLNCNIHQVSDETEAISAILGLVDGEETILGLSFDKIGVSGLEAALNDAGIHVDKTPNPEARYGVTGVDAALAATGSIVLSSGDGQMRVASLLPPIHIAVLRSEQVIQDLESWVALQESFTEPSNVFVVSGPSKTADIAMELVLGMHGPQELHLVLFL
jgi:L-lactate dehydrogenase complex protein LldG